ncbi:DUF2568 domain-containing protein [Streptomyces sp. NPDC005828]|uniref:DUF2568 domain-containing protein n=1 Tax=Streptomyces sp. NPDC005828 TaxID=3157071 RepID=UPI00340D6F16
MGALPAVGGPTGGLTVLDVAAFGSELAVYAAAAWWAWTRPARRAARLATTALTVAGLALLWGEFAAPTAAHPLHGAARAVFELCWYGAGSLAAYRAYTTRRRRTAAEPDL